MNDELITRARAALDGVTPGPWRLRPDDEEDEPAQCIKARGFDIATCWGGYIAGDSDAHFIAAARDLVPALVDEVERLTRDQRHIIDERDRTFALTLARAEAAEAKVAKLVEALREIAKEMHYPMGIGVDPAPTCAAKIARAALAEIEGDRK